MKARQKLELRPSAAPEVDEQIQMRLQQMVAGRVDALVLAALDQHITQLVDQAVMRHLAIMLDPPGGNRPPDQLGQGPLASMQQLMIAKFDAANINLAVEAIVAARVEELFGFATGSVAVPAQPLHLEGVPEMSEAEALAQARVDIGPAVLRSQTPFRGTKRVRKPNEDPQ